MLHARVIEMRNNGQEINEYAMQIKWPASYVTEWRLIHGELGGKWVGREVAEGPYNVILGCHRHDRPAKSRG